MAPVPPPPPLPAYDAALRDGSVLFWENSRLVKPILHHTGSDITHAAVILYRGTEPYVYEAVPPRVHAVPLDEYKKHMEEKSQRPALEKRDFRWFTMQPRVPYTIAELAAMKAHADSQLGRPYMIRAWAKEHEIKGVFCSEYAGDVIEKSDRIESAHTHESPGSLHDKLLPIYEETP